MVGNLYKILAKVLANRLKKVVGKVMSSAQDAFVEDRQVLDAMLIANQAIDSLLRRKERGILYKLDIEKAITKTRISLFRSWKRWVSTENGSIGLDGAFPLLLFLFQFW